MVKKEERGVIYSEIEKEVTRSFKKHGKMPINVFEQFAIVQEELGEVSKAILDYKYNNADFEDIKTELIQTAAMCVKMLQKINNGRISF